MFFFFFSNGNIFDSVARGKPQQGTRVCSRNAHTLCDSFAGEISGEVKKKKEKENRSYLDTNCRKIQVRGREFICA